MTMSGDLPPEGFIGKFHSNPPDGCECAYCSEARRAAAQSHIDGERAKRGLSTGQAVRGPTAPDGSIEDCPCNFCREARMPGPENCTPDEYDLYYNHHPEERE